MSTPKIRKSNTSNDTAGPKAFTLADARRISRKRSGVIPISLTIDDEPFIIYSKKLSLGMAARFSELQFLDAAERGGRSITVAKDFLYDYAVDSNGDSIFSGNALDDIEAEFASELVNAVLDHLTASQEKKAPTPAVDESALSEG